MWLVICLLGLARVIQADSVCGPVPASFIDVGTLSTLFQGSIYDVQMLEAFLMPYHVFGMDGFITATVWHNSGAVELKTYMEHGEQGLLVHIANTNWISMQNLTGTYYQRHTADQDDLDKIDGYICDDFIPQEAVVDTFECFHQYEEADSPKASYQISLVFGHDSTGENKTMLLIITDVLPGDEWDYMAMSAYRYHLYFRSAYYPLEVHPNSVLAIDVTNQQAFTPDVQPQIFRPPCQVQCSLTRAGTVVGFSGSVTARIANNKVLLAEWNPDFEDCKFRFLTSFVAGFQWLYLGVGPHVKPAKYFRFIDFDKIDGKVSQRGWRCQAGCRGEVTQFPHQLRNTDLGITYATVEEIVPGVKYTIESTHCLQASKPKFKLTYDFSAADDEPLATLTIDGSFYATHKDVMSGLCVDQSD